MIKSKNEKHPVQVCSDEGWPCCGGGVIECIHAHVLDTFTVLNINACFTICNQTEVYLRLNSLLQQ